MSQPEDHDVRLEALDPTHSFIVQAPAGSGKTELLTRRVLTLLCTVNEPEEILAITFTRKAASEMRQRVIETLTDAACQRETDDPYELEGRALALAALARDSQFNWQLIRNPQRLNLRTIDSLATQLAHRLPVTSTLGAPTGLVEQADVLYQEAAQRFIEAHLDSLNLVLLHLGNKLDKAQVLLANLLAKRDQWQRHVYGADDDHEQLRLILERMLADLVESRLENLCQNVPDGLSAELTRCLRKASSYALAEVEGDISELCWEMQLWHKLDELPGSDISDLACWESICLGVLTTENKLRKRLTVKEGFPPKNTAKKLGVEAAELVTHKEDMIAVLSVVEQFPEFIEALGEVRKLPDPQYKDEQWALLSQLLTVLPGLLFELQLVFAEHAQVDFAEISARASIAMGAEGDPTDLALSMDLALKHLLVDEFQDTSQTQFRLFEKLVQQWEAGDGRTFFAVGDPMQSIYRFREGDVGLFTRVQNEGIGPVCTKPLKLTVNFRASPIVTDWVNDTFRQVFPKHADADIGAVPYSESRSHKEYDGTVSVHTMVDVEKINEAAHVANLCAEAVSLGPEHSVAVLVRTRTQALDIFTALRERQLGYESIDMDLIGDRAVVKDLITIVMALRYPHDRLHWLSLLRAPFIGLTLTDLYQLMAGAESRISVIERLQDQDIVSGISFDGQQRLKRVMSIIEPACKQAMRSRLMPWVESVWLQLGGPAVCETDTDRDAAGRALRLLYLLEARGELWNKSTVDAALSGLYANPAAQANVQIQVMTLHKSKGLEFDTVILPALDRSARGDGSQLLQWFESTLHGKTCLLLAPFEQSGIHPSQRDKLNKLVQRAGQRCDDQEKLRLLYVACTRAKRHLHLIARVLTDKEGDIRKPNNASLLSPLWPIVENHCAGEANKTLNQRLSTSEGEPVQAYSVPGNTLPGSELVSTASDAAPRLDSVAPAFFRLPLDASLPVFNSYVQLCLPDQASASVKSDLNFRWAGRDARDIGTVVHDQLQILSELSSLDDMPDRHAQTAIVNRQLRNLGLSGSRVEAATARVMTAVSNTLSDEKGRWILDSHLEARSEWALSVPMDADNAQCEQKSGKTLNSTVQRVVIDRTFIDESGVRWIIDYKTSDNGGEKLDDFLDRECKRYADQLNRYADIIARIEERPVRVGLYFPMLSEWREWMPPKL